MFRYIVLVCLLVSVNAARKVPYWEDCGGNDAILKVHDIDLDNPIEISKSRPLRIGINATQLAEISSESRVSIKINKNLNILGQTLVIPVPCIEGIGTCEMSLCKLYSIHRKLACAIIEATNQECTCPTAPGEYVAKDAEYQLNLGLLPSAILAIGNGEYSLEMHMNDDNKELACLKIGVSVKFVQN